MSQITAIIFDIGGVIQKSDRKASSKMVGLPEVDYSALFKSDLDNNYSHLRKGIINSTQFIDNLYPRVKQLNPDVTKSQVRESLDFLLPPEPEMLQFLQILKSRYQLAILSNSWPEFMQNAIRAKGTENDYLQYFEPYIYLSYKIGKIKPNPDAYFHVLEQMQITPEQAIFIDNRPDNTAAARSLGLKTIDFQNIAQLKADLQDLG
ncbi:MAG: HAD family phosphatase [bacterium]